MNQTTRPLIFSIGHSNHNLEDFLELLGQHRIEVLVDVRSAPYSKYTVQFNGPALKTAVVAAGLKYLFLGKELGGRPAEPQFYDATGRVLYGQVAHSPLFLAGLARLEKGLATYRVAMMCSEEEPTNCHRRLLVGRVLAERGIQVQHIRGNGSLLSEDELARQDAADPQQLSLFPDEEEAHTWKSIRSVSPKKVPPPSSAS